MISQDWCYNKRKVPAGAAAPVVWIERQENNIDDGNTIQVVDIDRNKPFAIVLPINAGNITFYDVNRNTVEYWNNPL